jgi:pyruvate formate-lyase activating enzyme-like uncharacterized protein
VNLEDLIADVRAATLCRAGRHCRKGKRVKKIDGGKCPLLCCYCRKIVGHWR